MAKHLSLIIMALAFPLLTMAQVQEDKDITWQEREANIREMFDRIDQLEDSYEITRIADQIQEEMSEILTYDDFPYDYEFDMLPNINTVVSDDGLIYLYSWVVQLKDQNRTAQFYAICYNKALRTPFVWAQGLPRVPPEKGMFDENAWYGAMYYKISKISIKDTYGYLLFGYAPMNKFHQYSVIDVMTCTKRAAKFGSNIFVKEDGKKYSRVVFEYTGDEQMSIDIDKKKKKITFDELEVLGVDEDGKPIVKPGSTQGTFELKKGMWEYKGAKKSKKK